LPPHHVKSIQDFFAWIEQLVENAGAYFEDDTLIVEPLVDASGVERAYNIPRQTVLFWSDSAVLSVRMYLNENLDLTSYGFHYMTSQRRLIWRKDNVDGGRRGLRPHLHLPPETRRHRRFTAVDLEEALTEVQDYQRDGRLPRPSRR
jgi:hypothetical protein